MCDFIIEPPMCDFGDADMPGEDIAPGEAIAPGEPIALGEDIADGEDIVLGPPTGEPAGAGVFAPPGT